MHAFSWSQRVETRCMLMHSGLPVPFSTARFRFMRLTGAFFANRAEVVDEMLNVEGGFWASTTVAAGSVGFKCRCVVLCDTDPDDEGQEFTLCIDAAGPTGCQWTPAWSTSFTVPGRMTFMVTPPIALPLEPEGGGHTYSFRLTGQHARVDLDLDVLVTPAVN